MGDQKPAVGTAEKNDLFRIQARKGLKKEGEQLGLIAIAALTNNSVCHFFPTCVRIRLS